MVLTDRTDIAENGGGHSLFVVVQTRDCRPTGSPSAATANPRRLWPTHVFDTRPPSPEQPLTRNEIPITLNNPTT